MVAISGIITNLKSSIITWVTKGSSSLSTARVRISRLFGSHLKLMLAVLMVLMIAGKDSINQEDHGQYV